MTDRELLRQALEALESGDWYIGQLEPFVYSADDTGTHEELAKVQAAIAALRERLAQPQMQPCAGRNCGSTNPNQHSAECFEDYEKATGQGAALVAADERNKLVAWMIKHSYATGHGDTVEDLLKELEWQIEDRIKNIIRAKPTKPLRLFALQIGDTFVLRRNKQRFKLVNLPWIKGMSKQYICQNLENGQFTRLHHSVLVEQVEKHKE